VVVAVVVVVCVGVLLVLSVFAGCCVLSVVFVCNLMFDDCCLVLNRVVVYSNL